MRWSGGGRGGEMMMEWEGAGGGEKGMGGEGMEEEGRRGEGVDLCGELLTGER